jgi:hypothetical protein
MIACGKKEVEVIPPYKIVVVRTCILKFLHSDPPVGNIHKNHWSFPYYTLKLLFIATLSLKILTLSTIFIHSYQHYSYWHQFLPTL